MLSTTNGTTNNIKTWVWCGIGRRLNLTQVFVGGESSHCATIHWASACVNDHCFLHGLCLWACLWQACPTAAFLLSATPLLSLSQRTCNCSVAVHRNCCWLQPVHVPVLLLFSCFSCWLQPVHVTILLLFSCCCRCPNAHVTVLLLFIATVVDCSLCM